MGRPAGSKNISIHIWTKKEKEYLKQVTPGHHHKEIQELISKKFNRNFTLDQIKAAINRYKLNTGFTGRFETNHIPVNKGRRGVDGWKPTQFKKGNIPINHRSVGSERTNVDGYIEIKTAEPNKWRCKHVLVWEKQNGPVPKGYAVIFGDSDKTNLNIDNLILVSKKQLLMLNRQNLIQKDADLTRTGIIITDLQQKIHERKSKIR